MLTGEQVRQFRALLATHTQKEAAKLAGIPLTRDLVRLAGGQHYKETEEMDKFEAEFSRVTLPDGWKFHLDRGSIVGRPIPMGCHGGGGRVVDASTENYNGHRTFAVVLCFPDDDPKEKVQELLDLINGKRGYLLARDGGKDSKLVAKEREGANG